MHSQENSSQAGTAVPQALPRVQVVGAAVLDSLARPSKLLAARRSAPEALAGLWEFPGGKVEAGEGCTEALHRELAEELGIRVELDAEVPGPSEQGWPLNRSAAMRVWLAEVTDGTPEPLEDHDELRWVDLTEKALTALAWIPADLPIVTALLDAVAARKA
ncbi:MULTISPECIES: (deoxy)nucleoside triphosphate pyrophosphohydrolase [unclassified Arthrobacter]|uniref:(deoxy)nucleoside triphosphate pyrophosphohydrolase n=1 Tax=unclassified Arthrobacter TaxID=235627 RepID=UPI001E354580|nr:MULTISPECIES: (deoxy)nucleoside triphosphate pyrophosphohydrolase [unclassified Arthrobacter]MCC9146322.1 (deoxy)nucleoside triphosphate pyrophosphohydrolase [Arthrobacter sp. zg-Y919]MDK1277552.1 (deoxy)nucleoside triphosphate pyrophosphohydrolase [Arthrobacter sp. zg.Y919]WIB04035.1 (deoxy)nucleoside triphosphate pyrophosphohydrolase [Arthrobacter sp. zg-Y919]